MFTFTAILVALLQVLVNANCPSTPIKPCQCNDHLEVLNGENVHSSNVYCYGEIGLPKLSYILRTRLCGRQLHEFRLDSSDIGYLPSNLFYHLRVKSIKISSTNISHFTEAGGSAFYGLEKHLLTLSMRRCQLADQLQWQKIGDLEALETLDLSENHLTTIPRQWFDHPPKNLKFLHLQGNGIKYIQAGALSKMHNLILIDLSENRITNLGRDVFPYPANSITILRLSYNYLSSLPSNFFEEMFGLRRIYLDHNQFTTLDAVVWLPMWGDLYELDLEDNNITCDCNVRWITLLEEVHRLSGSCGEGNVLNGRRLDSLYYWDFNEFNCTNPEYMSYID